MKRTTKVLGSTTGMLAIAAFTGLIAGASHHASAATVGIESGAARASIVAKAGVNARNLDAPTTQHSCKTKNDCKGTGGCKTGDNGCKGMNSCKGKGGCNTNGNL